MPTFVQLAINVPSVAGVFDYALPESLAGQIGVGHLVIAPFGKQTVQGIVLRFLDQPSVAETKEIIELVDPESVLTQAQISLAESLAESSLSPLASIIGLFLPPGLNQQADVLYEIRNTQQAPETEIQKQLLNLLNTRGPLRGRQIEHHFAKVDWRKTAQALVKRGVLTSKSILPPSTIRPKFIRTAQLAVAP